MTRFEALIVLLAQPDPPYMRRGYRYTYARCPLRDPEVIKRNLATAYVTWRRQEHVDGDISSVVSVRRQLRVVRRLA